RYRRVRQSLYVFSRRHLLAVLISPWGAAGDFAAPTYLPQWFRVLAVLIKRIHLIFHRLRNIHFHQLRNIVELGHAQTVQMHGRYAAVKRFEIAVDHNREKWLPG